MTISNNRTFDRLFDDFLLPEFSRVRRTRSPRPVMSMPKVNILESEDGFVVELAAPGWEKSDFNIEVNEDVLTVSTKIENGDKEDSRVFIKREFGVASFERSFRLPDTIDGEKIAAAYDKGILSITLPKKEEAKPRPPKTIDIG